MPILSPCLQTRQRQAYDFLCLARDRHFLPAHSLTLLQGKVDHHLSFLAGCSSFGKFISVASFPSHLQKNVAGTYMSHIHVCGEDGGVGCQESRTLAGLNVSPYLQLC